MKKRIGLTGGTGFIGQYLIRDYGDEYDFVAITSRADCSGLSPKAQYVNLPYDRDGFRKAFAGCEAVVHLGGHVIKGSEKDIDAFPFIQNISLSDNVFSACRELKIHNIVNASSVAVYAQSEDHPIKEEDLLEPNSVYGVCKIATEQLARLYNSKYGMHIKSLRYAQVLGYREVHTLFYGMLLRNASSGIPITIWGNGIAGRDIVYVRDASRAAIVALEHPECSGTYNIGHGRAFSNMDLALAYVEGFESAAGIEMVPVEREDTHRWCIDCSKAERELGFRPAFDMIAMARDICREMKAAECAQKQ